MQERDSAIECAHQLADALNQIGADLPAGFERHFVVQARRVGEGAHGDLGALIMIECLEAKRAGRVLDATEIRRALDRVRHRLVREASGQRRRFRQLAISDVVDRREPMVGQEVDNLDTIRMVLSGLTAQELLVFELFAEGRTSEEIGRNLGVSSITVRQRMSRIRRKLRERYRALCD